MSACAVAGSITFRPKLRVGKRLIACTILRLSARPRIARGHAEGAEWQRSWSICSTARYHRERRRLRLDVESETALCRACRASACSVLTSVLSSSIAPVPPDRVVRMALWREARRLECLERSQRPSLFRRVLICGTATALKPYGQLRGQPIRTTKHK